MDEKYVLAPKNDRPAGKMRRWMYVYQNYQNFCGFDTLETAQLFLAVFEKLYRFTPFSADAQPGIRGKCPLELAGYDIRQMPMVALCQGLSFDWPVEMTRHDVPK